MNDKSVSHEDEIDTFPGDMQVREGRIPAFLKVVYVGFTVFAFAYWFLYKAGDTSLPLIQLYNAATGLGQ